MGASSGYPAVKHEVSTEWDPLVLADRDILAISVTPALQQEMDDENAIPMILQEGKRSMNKPLRNEKVNLHNDENSRKDDRQASENINVSTGGHLAAVVGMESPYTKGRSVLAVMAANSADLDMVTQAVADSGKIGAMHGSVVIFREDQVSSYQVGNSYFVGKLPVWQLVWYTFSGHPFLMLFFGLLLIIMLVVICLRILNSIVKKRLGEGEKK
jgi:hypothetical protein